MRTCRKFYTESVRKEVLQMGGKRGRFTSLRTGRHTKTDEYEGKEYRGRYDVLPTET